MMYASHYMSEWTSALTLCEMPIRMGVRAKSLVGSGLAAAHIGGVCVRGHHCWRSEDRRYEGKFKGSVNDARSKAAATNSTATSTPGNFRVPIFAFPLSALNLVEVKNEKLQH